MKFFTKTMLVASALALSCTVQANAGAAEADLQKRPVRRSVRKQLQGGERHVQCRRRCAQVRQAAAQTAGMHHRPCTREGSRTGECSRRESEARRATGRLQRAGQKAKGARHQQHGGVGQSLHLPRYGWHRRSRQDLVDKHRGAKERDDSHSFAQQLFRYCLIGYQGVWLVFSQVLMRYAHPAYTDQRREP